MQYPLVDLGSPTKLVFEWGWLLVTAGNFVVYVLLFVVFLVGMTVRLPGARRDLRAVEREHAEGGA